MLRFSAIVLIVFAFSPKAYAEDGPVIYKQKTEVDFEAVDVEGELKKPPGQIIMSRESALFNPLLPPRLHFNSEMLQSIDDVK